VKAPGLQCTRCHWLLPVESANQPDLVPCPHCREWLDVNIFPALFRPPPPVTTGEKLVIEGEASCFYHPQKKAVVPCVSCGRFLCALCDVEFNDQHLCPACLEVGKKKGKIVNLQKQRTRYDRMTFWVGLAPFCMLPITPVTGAIAIYMAARYWNAPLSLVAGNKGWFVAGAILGGIQIVAGLVFYYYIIHS